MIEFCGCESLKRNSKCSNKNCPETKSKKKVWVVSGNLLDFGKPVTGPEAVAAAAKIKELQEEIQHELRR